MHNFSVSVNLVTIKQIHKGAGFICNLSLRAWLLFDSLSLKVFLTVCEVC